MTDQTAKPAAPEADLTALFTTLKESKAGYKTTEFWITLVLSVLTLLGALPIPDHYKAYVVSATTVAYVLSRGIAKAGVGAVDPAPGE